MTGGSVGVAITAGAVEGAAFGVAEGVGVAEAAAAVSCTPAGWAAGGASAGASAGGTVTAGCGVPTGDGTGAGCGTAGAGFGTAGTGAGTGTGTGAGAGSTGAGAGSKAAQREWAQDQRARDLRAGPRRGNLGLHRCVCTTSRRIRHRREKLAHGARSGFCGIGGCRRANNRAARSSAPSPTRADFSFWLRDVIDRPSPRYEISSSVCGRGHH